MAEVSLRLLSSSSTLFNDGTWRWMKMFTYKYGLDQTDSPDYTVADSIDIIAAVIREFNASAPWPLAGMTSEGEPFHGPFMARSVLPASYVMHTDEEAAAILKSWASNVGWSVTVGSSMRSADALLAGLAFLRPADLIYKLRDLELDAEFKYSPLGEFHEFIGIDRLDRAARVLVASSD